MIQRLQLRRWRAFEEVDLTLERGTTFIVAPNGVGKTSLILAMAWGIFGDHAELSAEVRARDCIRAGADNAEVEVTLLLPDERTLHIKRSVALKGRPKVWHLIDGSPIDEQAAQGLIEDTFEAQLPVAAQLSMMLGGAHVASATALDLRDHLTTAFGVSSLRQAAERAAKIAKAATKERENIRRTARTGLEDRVAKEREFEEITRELEAHRLQRESLSDALDASNALIALLQEWSSYETAATRRQAVVSDVLAAVREVVPNVAGEAEVPAALDDEAARLRRDMKNASDQLASARAQILSCKNALSLLQAESPSCPTCLRPFHGQELSAAIEEQESARRRAEHVQAEVEQTIGGIEERMMRLDKLRQSWMQLPEEPIAPPDPRPNVDPTKEAEAALLALQEHDKEAGRIEQRRDLVTKALKEDDEIRRLEQEQVAAYRFEAMTAATAAALDRAAEAVTEGYLEPLASKVRGRWKTLFGVGGLQLRPDGSVVRVVGERELPWETLSGGERIWARLVTHLLVISASTKLTFAWFDEPLEHLDPMTRRAVATALATATHPGSPTQLIVTTYEHAIARQLAADIPETSIKYLRRSA